MILSFESQRVLGSLMEKEMVTPDTYPLSINALIAAANQRSSREPVTDFSEDEVREALDTLEANELVTPARDSGRVTKYEHRVRTVLNLRRDETAVLCLLLLRGPQTPGELRSRSDRMFTFEDLAQVQSSLERLAAREEPIVRQLARVPGSREARWAHLLGSETIPATHFGAQVSAHHAQADQGEFDTLRAAIASLEERVRALEDRLPPSVESALS